MTTGFAIVLAPIVLGAGALLSWGQHGGPKAAFLAGLAIVSLSVLYFAGSLVSGGFDKLDRAYGRAQSGRFDDRRLARLARAIDRGDDRLIGEILGAGGIDFAARDRRGRTILGHAVTGALEYGAPPGRVESVRRLLEAGAEPVENAIAPERTSAEPEVPHPLAVLEPEPWIVPWYQGVLPSVRGLDAVVASADRVWLLTAFEPRRRVLESALEAAGFVTVPHDFPSARLLLFEKDPARAHR